jgi:hypothetical protein
LVWLHKGEQFFRTYNTPPLLKVWTSSFYLDGTASQWYYRWENNLGCAPSWEDFSAGVNRRFGPPDRANPLGELAHLRCTGSVDEYQEFFLNLLARCEDVSEKHQVALFTAGLLLPLCVDVELQNPATLEDAMALARPYERRLALPDDAPRGPSRPAPTGRQASRSLQPLASKPPVTPPTSGGSLTTLDAPTKSLPPPGRFYRLSAEEMARLRLDGLCFNCLEKFSREHAKQCSMRGVYYLDAADDDESAATEATTDEDMTISMHALSGVRTTVTLSLDTTIAATKLAALVDSQPTHCFIAEGVARRLQVYCAILILEPNVDKYWRTGRNLPNI